LKGIRMGFRRKKISKAALRRKAAWSVALFTALGLGVLVGCSSQGGSNIASPLASPKPTGTPEHPFLFEWGTYGSDNGKFDSPSAVAVNTAGTTVYVADQNNDRVQAFSPSGGYLTQWAATLPAGLAVDGSSHVYLTTQEYVQQFNSGGTVLLASGGGPGTQLGQLAGPLGLAVNAAGTTLYVADSSNQRVQAVTFLSSGSVPSYGITEVGYWGLGNNGVSFSAPAGIVLGPANSLLYLLDEGSSRVWALNLSGGSSFAWGSLGPNPGQFNQPLGLAVDPNSGNLYVADTGNNRIEEFGPNGNFSFQWGGPGVGNGFFHSPKAVAVDAGGNIYVVDSGNNLIQKFGP
jgi:DNA-binding beta-propeller fold protein YncE